MSTAHDPHTDPQNDPQDTDASDRSWARRRLAVPLAFVGGAAAVALIGAAVLSGPERDATTAMSMVRAERPAHAGHAGDGRHGTEHGTAHGTAHGTQMQRRSAMDPAVRDEHLSELAALAGTDVDELRVTLEALRAEHMPDREAMRAAMSEALGIDAADLAELHDGAGHGQRAERMEERMEGRMQQRSDGRMGPDRHA